MRARVIIRELLKSAVLYGIFVLVSSYELRKSSEFDPVLRRMKVRLQHSSRLHRAAAAGMCELILQLVQAGTPVDLRCGASDSNTALHYAAACGHTAAVYLIVRLGAQMQNIGECGFTALGMAVRAAHAPVVEVLLLWGAPFSRHDSHLLEAALNTCGQDTVMHLCLKGALNEQPQRVKDRLLVLTACRKDYHLPLIRELLRAGANPTAEGVYEGGSSGGLLSLAGPQCCHPQVLKELFNHIWKCAEPLTPLQLKGLSIVQRRYLHRRSRSF